MGLVVQHNLPAINAQNQMRVNLSNNQKASEKLSSGYRINRAGDDAAGLAISEKMRGQIRGLDQASANAQDGISLVQTAEGALQETHSILQRMRELAVQSANGTYQNEVDRENINKEVDALKSEIDRIATSTHFNGKKLLDGTMSGTEKAATKAATAIDGSAAAFEEDLKGTDVATVTAEITFKSNSDATKTTKEQAIAENKLANHLAANGITITTNSDGTKVVGLGTLGSDYTVESTGDVAADIKDSAGNVLASVSFTLTNAGNDATHTIKGGGDITAAKGAIAVGDEVSPAGGELILQIGANGAADQEVALSVADQSSEGLGIDDISVSTRTAAKNAIADIDDAINSVSGTRADLGALQNRLEHTINNLSTSSENLTAAESRIRDTDMAKEMMNYTKSNILQQAAQAMLAQANVQPQSVLQLLG